MGYADTIQVLGAFVGHINSVLGAAAQQSAPLCTLSTGLKKILMQKLKKSCNKGARRQQHECRFCTRATGNEGNPSIQSALGQCNLNMHTAAEPERQCARKGSEYEQKGASVSRL